MECGTEVAATEFAPSYRRAAIMQASLAILGFLASMLVWLRGNERVVAGWRSFAGAGRPVHADCHHANQQRAPRSVSG